MKALWDEILKSCIEVNPTQEERARGWAQEEFERILSELKKIHRENEKKETSILCKDKIFVVKRMPGNFYPWEFHRAKDIGEGFFITQVIDIENNKKK